MKSGRLIDEIARRRTFAIISHPDAGKTTVTEKFLLLGGAINVAGTVKARKSSRFATSDWMGIEQQRGISVTSSVMQFEYRGRIVNLLDTPGHEDFSEDTYRTLTAVDSALMVIDAAKGVEERTIKLLEICRMRNTPIITLINKLDRHGRDPLDLIDEVEQVLRIHCAPITWPLGSGQHFRGIYHLLDKRLIAYERKGGERSAQDAVSAMALDDPAAESLFGNGIKTLREEIALIDGAGHQFDLRGYLRGEITPVFFGTALHNFGIRELLDYFVNIAPPPQPRLTDVGEIRPDQAEFSGFVFKIQANMDPQHRDRIAFVRVCSGQFEPGMRLRHVRLQRDIQMSNAVTFMARARDRAGDTWPGDIVGFYNHGTIRIGDTFTGGSAVNFTGIPSFAPELFRRVRTRDPLRSKALIKGLTQLCEEGAAQVFRMLSRSDVILGAVGVLQFDVVAWRLQHEYAVDCVFESVPVQLARWVSGGANDLARFKALHAGNAALDSDGQLAYLAPTKVNLQLVMEKWPQLQFHATREVNPTHALRN